MSHHRQVRPHTSLLDIDTVTMSGILMDLATWVFERNTSSFSISVVLSCLFCLCCIFSASVAVFLLLSLSPAGRSSPVSFQPSLLGGSCPAFFFYIRWLQPHGDGGIPAGLLFQLDVVLRECAKTARARPAPSLAHIPLSFRSGIDYRLASWR